MAGAAAFGSVKIRVSSVEERIRINLYFLMNLVVLFVLLLVGCKKSCSMHLSSCATCANCLPKELMSEVIF